MYRRGDLISPAEGAIIASVPRQTAARWIREASINVKAARLRYLARCHLKAERHAAGLPPRRRPSKSQMRKDADKALRDWNAASAPKPL